MTWVGGLPAGVTLVSVVLAVPPGGWEHKRIRQSL
jgi:hypothetical protein